MARDGLFDGMDICMTWHAGSLNGAPRRDGVDDLYKRVLNCAHGAAQITDTRADVELIKAIWNMLSHSVVEDVLEEVAHRIGPPEFGEEDFWFAREISKSFAPGQREAQLRKE